MDNLPDSVLRFDTLLNEPPAFENETRVREYRHQLWPRWQEVVNDIRTLQKQCQPMKD